MITITSDMCAGIHISRGYTYHCDTGIELHGELHVPVPRGPRGRVINHHAVGAFWPALEGHRLCMCKRR